MEYLWQARLLFAYIQEHKSQTAACCSTGWLWDCRLAYLRLSWEKKQLFKVSCQAATVLCLHLVVLLVLLYMYKAESERRWAALEKLLLLSAGSRMPFINDVIITLQHNNPKHGGKRQMWLAAAARATQDMVTRHRQLLLVKFYSCVLDTKLTLTSDFLFSVLFGQHMQKELDTNIIKLLFSFRMKKSQDEIKDDTQNWNFPLCEQVGNGKERFL